MKTLSFLLRRAGWSLAVVLFVVTATFVLVHALKTDPARVYAGPHASDATIRAIRRRYRLDRPLPEQYLHYLAMVARGDLGRSGHLNQDVAEAIAERFPRTALLAVAAVVLQVFFGVGIGLLCAVRKNTVLDYGSMGFALVGISAPTFFTGLLLLYFVAFRLGWFPIGGYGTGALGHLAHLVLPATTLGIYGAAYYSRLVRGEMIEILGQDYVRTARAKGLSPSSVLLKHALKNGLLPIVTVIALDLGVLLSGAIITEEIFNWPGMGRLAFDGIFNDDRPLILGTVLVAAILIVAANLLADVAYALLDPRVRLE